MMTVGEFHDHGWFVPIEYPDERHRVDVVTGFYAWEEWGPWVTFYFPARLGAHSTPRVRTEYVPLEWQLLCALRRRNTVSTPAWGTLRSLQSGPGVNQNNILKVLVCRMRPKLKAVGVKIWVVWGTGTYYLDDAGKKRLDEAYGTLPA